MKPAKEPKDVDSIIKSEPWTEEELVDFRDLMQKMKRRNKLKNKKISPKTKRAIIRKAR